jgi:hypothetical protein
MFERYSLKQILLATQSRHVTGPAATCCPGGKAHQSHVRSSLCATRWPDHSKSLCRPVGLKEAALDSPTFRATTVHFSEQVDLVEKWAEEYLKSTNKLVAESATLENVIGNFLLHALLPNSITEAVLDHDYSILAMRKYGEGAKDFWMSTLGVIKRLTTLAVEPIRSFLHNDLRAFKVGIL